MDKDLFNNRILAFKDKNPIFSKYQNYHLFTILCIKYFFYSDDSNQFDESLIDDILTDGANDGGIDAIFNDPNSENSDIIIVQSKYYEKTKLNADKVSAELFKINDTIKNLSENKICGYNEKLVTAYKNAISQILISYVVNLTN